MKLIANSIILGGPNANIEIDESMFTRRKNQVGLVLPQQWVFGALYWETGECFLIPVPNRPKSTLMPIITTNILLCITIISDQWRAYNSLRNMPHIKHQTVNHSVNFIDPESGANTQKNREVMENSKGTE